MKFWGLKSGAYPLRDSYEIFRVYGKFHDGFAFYFGRFLLLRNYEGLLLGRNSLKIVSAPKRRNY